MAEMIPRRDLLTAGGACWALAVLRIAPAAGAAPRIGLGAAAPFSFDALVEQARTSAGQPYVPPPALAQEVLERLDYQAHGQIHFKPEYALFADGPGQFPVTFFHLGRYFQTPVQMYVVEDEMARALVYDPAYFDIPPDSPARALPRDAGFAGFRVQESRLPGKPLSDPSGPAEPSGSDRPAPEPTLDWQHNDWVAFLGASYFRAIGAEYQYGLSARGVAVDVAVAGRSEEFPRFTQIYFETPAAEPGDPLSDTVTVCALLDGPSLAGAYRFRLRRDQAVLMEVECALFVRADIERLGLAPLTSMYWFSETVKPAGVDWRPEVHDSDGLAMWTGRGEHIWRPLNNPQRTTVSAFSDGSPRGFGLLQRDRTLDHYLDGVHYERRPSLWVEPLEDWGAGQVQLVEIPTDDEINDNIVAMWVPREPARAGAQYRLHYRLHWDADEPNPPPLARCVASRLGRGGQPGQPRPPGVEKFVVEFLGAPLAALPFGVRPEPVLSATRGWFSDCFAEAVPDGVAGHWRIEFDLHVDGPEPVELRLYLKSAEQTLSETWLYQYARPMPG